MKKILTIFTMAYACTAYAQPSTWSEAGEGLFFLNPARHPQGLTLVAENLDRFDKDGMRGYFSSFAFSLDSDPNSLVFAYSAFNIPEDSDLVGKEPGENITALLLHDFEDYQSSGSLSDVKFAVYSYWSPQTISDIQYLRTAGMIRETATLPENSPQENFGFKIEYGLNGGVGPWNISETIYMYVPNAQAFKMATGTVVGTTSETTFNYLTPVPEPGLMVAAGIGALAVLRKRKAPKG